MSIARTDPESTEMREPTHGSIAKYLNVPLRVIPKNGWTHSAAQIVERLLETLDSPTAYIIIRQLQEICKESLTQLESRVILKIPGKKLEVLGAEIAMKAKAKKYKYESSHLNQLEADLEYKKNEVKLYQQWMENLKEPTADPSTGEVIKPAELLEGGVCLSVTFPKE